MAKLKVDITYQGRDLTVLGEYHKAHRGYRNSYGVPEEPDDPEEIEIDHVMLGKRDVTRFVNLEKIESAVWALPAEEPDYSDYDEDWR